MSRAPAIVLLLAVWALPVPATELGRLFFTPAERAALDQARNGAEITAVIPAAPPSAPALDLESLVPATPQPAITVNGYVQRSTGPATVWINGTDSFSGDLSAHAIKNRDVRIRNGKVEIESLDGTSRHSLKPGESYDPESEQVSDIYQHAAPAPSP